MLKLPEGILQEQLKECHSVLDMGCSRSSRLQHIDNKKLFKIGVDCYEKYIKESKLKNIHDRYLKCNFLEYDFSEMYKKIDAVIALDVVEHLSKKDTLTLIKIMEKIAKKLVLVGTHNGFVPQDKAKDGNVLQKHVSGWSVQDFTTRGYKVHGTNGLFCLRDKQNYNKIKYKPKILFDQISNLTNLYVYNRPEKAAYLMAIKRFN